jgi:hypothetical protein
LNSQTNSKEKKDHPCKRHEAQWEGRKCRYSNQGELRAPQVRPP